MKRIVTLLSLCMVLTASAGAAFQPPRGPTSKAGLMMMSPRQLFNRIDTNKDGKISREEFKSFFARVAPRMAKNKPELADRVFDRADEDGSGYLDFPEFKAMVARIRERMAQKGKQTAPQREP